MLYRVLDATLIPAIVRVRAPRKGLFAGQASFGRSASKTEWVYVFKAALVDPEGVISAFGLAAAASDERPIADALIASERHGAYLAAKVAAYTCGQRINDSLGRPLRHIADLLV